MCLTQTFLPSVDVTLSVKKHQSYRCLNGTFQFSLLKTKRVQRLYNSRQCQRAIIAIEEQGVIKTMKTSSKIHAMEGVIISEGSLQSQVCMSLLEN